MPRRMLSRAMPAILTLWAGLAAAQEAETSKAEPPTETLTDQSRAAAERVLSEALSTWPEETEIWFSTIRTQNKTVTGLNQSLIQMRDEAWKAEVESGEGRFFDLVTRRPLSTFLKKRVEESDVIKDAFIADARGLLVAQSGVTGDYYQGDEPKWNEVFPEGSGAMLIEEPAHDPEVGETVITASGTITHPKTDEPIGVLTLAIDPASLREDES